MIAVSSIVILDSAAYVRHRIKEIVRKYGIRLHEVGNSSELFTMLQKKKDEISLIITELELDKENGLEVIRRAKSRGYEIPVIVLTAQNKKDTFVKSIEAGASDYILKPFEDEFLLSRIISNMKSDEQNGSASLGARRVYMDFNKYISGELRKAEKGNYSISLIMSVINKDSADSGYGMKAEDKLFSELYSRINSLFWDTDIFMSFGNQSYIGVLPFCTQENTSVVDEKIKSLFDEIKITDERFRNYSVENTFVTFPTEISSRESLFPMLTDKLRAGEEA